MKYRLIKTLSIALSLMFVMTSCGKPKNNEVNDITDLDNKVTSEDKATSDVWKESLQVKGNKTLTVEIDAKESVPDNFSPQVMLVSEPEFNKEYKNRIVNTLLYSDKKSVKDNNAPRGLLYDKWVFYKEALFYDEWANEQSEGNDYDSFIAYEKTKVDEYADKLSMTANDIYYEPINDTGNIFIGKRDGIDYYVAFSSIDDSSEGEFSDEIIFSNNDDRDRINTRRKYIYYGCEDLSKVCPEELKEKTDITCTSETAKHANNATISRDDAEKIANKFFEDINISNMSLIENNNLGWRSVTDPDTLINYGYKLKYTLSIGDEQVCYEKNLGNLNYWIDNYDALAKLIEIDSSNVYSSYVVAELLITDDGVIKAVISNPVEVIETKTVNNIINSQQAMEIIRKDIIENPAKNLDWSSYKTTIKFDYFRLGYLRVNNADKTFYYVPAWKLVSVDEKGFTAGIVAVNAMDGSPIYFKNEYLGYEEGE